jgi:uncharacterized protein
MKKDRLKQTIADFYRVPLPTFTPRFLEVPLETGKLLENLVAVEHLRQGKQIYFFREKVECDFIVKEKEEEGTAIQVSWSIVEPGTILRESKGLPAAWRRNGLERGTIITSDEKETIVEKGIEITVIPAYKYCLS